MGYIDDMNKQEEYIDFFNNVNISLDKIYIDIKYLIETYARQDLLTLLKKYDSIEYNNIDHLRSFNIDNKNKLKEIENIINNDRMIFSIENIKYI